MQLQNGFHCIQCHNQQHHQRSSLATGHWTYDAGQCSIGWDNECLFVPSSSSSCQGQRGVGSSSSSSWQGPPNPAQRVRYGPSGEMLTPRGELLRDSDSQPNPSQRIQYGPNGEALTPRGGWLRDSDVRTFTFDGDGDAEMEEDKTPDHSSFLQVTTIFKKDSGTTRTST